MALQEAAAGTYTYTVYATNANGNGPSSATSSSVVVVSVFSPAGAYDSLATVTLASTTSTITFTGIPSGYKHLQVKALHRGTVGAGDGTVYMRFNDDSGSNYSWHRLYGYGGGSAGADSSVSTTAVAAGQSMGATPSIQAFSAMITDVFDYASSTKNKTVRSLAGTDLNNDASGAVFFNSGAWYNTAPITSIAITTNQTAFAQYSSFALYGVK